MNKEYITLREFCERIQISSSTAYRMIRNGQLPAYKVGRNYRVTLSVIADLEKSKNIF